MKSMVKRIFAFCVVCIMMLVLFAGSILVTHANDATVKANILSHELEGTYNKDQVGSASAGPEKSYDGNATTRWNPDFGSYSGSQAIVYTLDTAYDLSSISITAEKPMFFKLFISEDKTNWTEIGAVTEAGAYTDLVCKFENIQAANIKYVRILITGRDGGSSWGTFNEVEVFANEVKEEIDLSGLTGLTIKGYELVGTFLKDQVGSVNAGPEMAYDGDAVTRWNPDMGQYNGTGIIFEIEENCDVGAVTLLSEKIMYFRVAVSSDKETWTDVGIVGSADDYNDGVAVVAEINGENAKYVRFIFTGRSDGSTWGVINEINILGEINEVEEPPVEEPPAEEPPVEEPPVEDNPPTGDYTTIGLMSVVLCMSICCAVVFAKSHLREE